MSAIQRKQCPRCGRFLADSARVHWPCVLARLTQTWVVRLPAVLLTAAAALALVAALVVNVLPGLLFSVSAPAASLSSSMLTAVALENLTTPSARVGSAASAEVIVAQAPLYDAPAPNSLVVRTAARGERFAILAQADVGDLWYQVSTEAGPLWVSVYSVAVAQGDTPIPVTTVTGPTQAIVFASPTPATLLPPPAALLLTPATLLPPPAALTFSAPATAVPTIAATVVQPTCGATAQTTAVFYNGPGTSFSGIEALTAGQPVVLDGQASDSGGNVWWRAQGSGLWVDSDVMTGDPGCANLPFMPAGSIPPPTPANCPGSQAPRLRVGGQARALVDGLALAQTAGGSESVADLTAGQLLTVIGGPVCAPLGEYSVTWWRMQAAPGVAGWAYEDAGGVYYFTPVE